MKCYKHRNSDAIGICKSCGKALCEECAVDLDFAITCPGDCEERASASHKLSANAIAVYSEQKRNKFVYPTFITALGLVFLMFGIIQDCAINSFTVVAGFVFFAFGIMLFIIQIRLNKKINI